VLLQDLDRFPHADPGDPELFGELALGRQPVAGADLAVMDQGSQVLRHGLGQRLCGDHADHGPRLYPASDGQRFRRRSEGLLDCLDKRAGQESYG
jgi:hypothetical protein